MVKKDNEKDLDKNTDKDTMTKDTGTDKDKDSHTKDESKKTGDLDIDLDEMDTDKTTTPVKKKKPRKPRKRFIVRNDPSGNPSVTDDKKHAKRKIEDTHSSDNPSDLGKKSPSSRRDGGNVKRPKHGSNIIRIPTDLLSNNTISGGIIMSIEGSSNLSDFLSSLQNSTDKEDKQDKEDQDREQDKESKKPHQKTETQRDVNLDSEGFTLSDTYEDDDEDHDEYQDENEDNTHDKTERSSGARKGPDVEVETVNEEEETDDTELEEEQPESELPYFKIKEYKKIDNLPQRLYPIDSLQKVISLGHLYRHPNFKHKNYSVNVKGLYQMIPALQKLNGLVGLEKIKRKVIDQIMFFSQDLHNQEWYYYQQQKLLAQQYEQDQGHFHHPLRPPPRGNHHGPRHPLETLLQIIPLQGPPPHSRNQKEDEMYWAGGGGGGGKDDHGSGRGGRGGRSGSGRRGGRGNRGKSSRGGRREGQPGYTTHPKNRSDHSNHSDHSRASETVDTPQKGLDPNISDESSDMLHTVIAGPPGVGKTVFGKILADIYLSLGITSRNSFKIVRRSDLVGEYLGQTAIKTQKAIDSALGGVLFIDEAYSLGCNDGRRKSDSFSKECIDTINQNLSEKKGQFICIIAGYPEELERHFFSVNPGLKRRFGFHYQIEGYDWKELAEILCRKISSIGWKLDSEARKWLFQDKGFMEDHIKDFPNFGGDIETLLLNIKIVHGRRVFGMHPREHKLIREIDIKDGYHRYQSSNRGREEPDPAPTSMYM